MKYIHLTLSEAAGINLLPGIRETEHKGQVFFLKDDLSYGPLPVDVENFYPREQWLQDFFGEYSLEAQQVPYFNNQKILKEIDDLLKQPNTTLIIWVAQTARDQTWIRYLAKFFQEWDAIKWINLPNVHVQDRTSHYENADPFVIKDLFSFAKHLSTSTIETLSSEYNALLKERSLLRVINADNIQTVPLHFFDDKIMKLWALQSTSNDTQLDKHADLPVGEAFINARLEFLKREGKVPY